MITYFGKKANSNMLNQLTVIVSVMQAGGAFYNYEILV
jgi:hypothetical protein